MTLKELLGESYHDGMSFDEVEKALEGKNLADLSSGRYVDKDKFNKLNDEFKAKSSAYDELATNTKDYEDLLKFKTETETKQKREALNSKLKEAGFTDEFLEYGSYLVEQGKIENNDKLVENARLFLDEHKQYGTASKAEDNSNPNGQSGGSTISTTLPNGDGKTEVYESPKIGVRHAWNNR